MEIRPRNGEMTANVDRENPPGMSSASFNTQIHGAVHVHVSCNYVKDLLFIHCN